jgi:hypothetical protein
LKGVTTPSPPVEKGHNAISPFGKGGLRGIYKNLLQPLFSKERRKNGIL